MIVKKGKKQKIKMLKLRQHITQCRIIQIDNLLRMKRENNDKK